MSKRKGLQQRSLGPSRHRVSTPTDAATVSCSGSRQEDRNIGYGVAPSRAGGVTLG